METAKLIAEVVAKQGISEYRLAKELGVDPSAVSHWKHGKAHPNGPHLMELLRRAGRLAAMVVLGVFVTLAATPQNADAALPYTEKSLNNQTTVYYVKLLGLACSRSLAGLPLTSGLMNHLLDR